MTSTIPRSSSSFNLFTTSTPLTLSFLCTYIKSMTTQMNQEICTLISFLFILFFTQVPHKFMKPFPFLQNMAPEHELCFPIIPTILACICHLHDNCQHKCKHGQWRFLGNFIEHLGCIPTKFTHFTIAHHDYTTTFRLPIWFIFNLLHSQSSRLPCS